MLCHLFVVCFPCKVHVGSCDQVPVSIPGVLAYTAGSIEAWIRLSKVPKPRLSACSSSLLHGTFSQGYNPTVAAIVSNSTKDKVDLKIVVAHHSYGGTDPSTCGMPQPVASSNVSNQIDIALDAWSFWLPTDVTPD